MLAIVLLGSGITFTSAQTKENAKMQKAGPIETLQKEVVQEIKVEDSVSAEPVELKPTD